MKVFPLEVYMKRIIKVGALAASSFSLLFLAGCSSNNKEVAQYGDKKIAGAILSGTKQLSD